MASVVNSAGTAIHQVPDEIYVVLSRDLELSDAEIAILTPKERFEKYCNWEGLINYGDKLWELVVASL